jgi:hypothetical protein
MRLSKKEHILALDPEVDRVVFNEEINGYLYFNDSLNPEKIQKVNVRLDEDLDWHYFILEKANKDHALFTCREHFDMGGSEPCYKKFYVITSDLKWESYK